MHNTSDSSESFKASLFPPHSRLTRDTYQKMYQTSLKDPEGFWGEHGRRLDWIVPYTRVKNVDYKDNARIRWYEDGVLNACWNCVDRHVKIRGSHTALLYVGDSPEVQERITYAELKEKVCRLANALLARGVRKGDRVAIYMPMIPEAAVAMLACARIGVIHTVVFGGFSANALKDRIVDCGATAVITANVGLRAGKTIPLKANTDQAIKDGTEVHTVIVFQRTPEAVSWHTGRDVWWHEICAAQTADCPCAPMAAEDPLFILYTSGSTGKPKGVLHTTGGYLVYTALTHEMVFDPKPDDVYWCTADVGWVTGHSYVVYGPLANGTTSLIFEGVPSFPDFGRFWQIVEKYKVNIFYTAPTALRSLLREGDQWVKRYDRSSLRILGSVGEPINEEAWLWYYQTVGEERCPIADTWWQTETGGILMTSLPGIHDLKPGWTSHPFFGVRPALVDQNGMILEGEAEGNLVLCDSWPGQMRTVYNDHDRFVQTYFSTYPGLYFTGDGARRDAEGCYRITGRVDDVLNVSGHRLGTAEIENALNAHVAVAESAVVGFPHEIKGQGIYAYLVLKEGFVAKSEMRQELIMHLRQVIGPIATPDQVLFVPGLPKTRSGKIMRRILRKIAEGDVEHLGDVSTLADPGIVEAIVDLHQKKGKAA